LAVIPALLVAGSVAFVACGGDDDDDGGGGGGGNGSDEEYVRDLCNALGSFSDEFGELSGNLDPSNVEELEDLMDDAAEVIGNVVEDLEDANPPADAAEFNESFVTTFSEFRDALEDGDFESILTFSPPEYELPQDVEDRLSAVAEETDECQELGVFGE
jgi:hypothetical protein